MVAAAAALIPDGDRLTGLSALGFIVYTVRYGTGRVANLICSSGLRTICFIDSERYFAYGTVQ